MLHDEVRYDFLMYVLGNFSGEYCKKHFHIGFNSALQCLYFPSSLLKVKMRLKDSISFSEFSSYLHSGQVLSMVDVTEGAEYHHVSELIFSLYTGSNLFMFALLRFFFFFCWSYFLQQLDKFLTHYLSDPGFNYVYNKSYTIERSNQISFTKDLN